ncbi:ATP-grasp ribosomal peptide maturase [Streptomyces sp. NPDC000927]|uniref:ATP-grasp ribosomal peptide maturase n=1 Tax=Streptomyces sp. NPDC000927 TaxID=3154371 RepID=UPI0033183663
MRPSVLVVTRDKDISADPVVAQLIGRGLQVARFDVGDFPESLTQAAYLIPGRGRWTGSLKGAHRDVDLSTVRAVWYRKPAPVGIHPGMTETETQWATAEATAGLGGLLAALPDAHWVNHPDRNKAADHKPRQLALADACGLTVPESLLTNSPERARAFCHSNRETGVIYKPLTGGPGRQSGEPVALWASTVTADQITEGVARTAHLFQVRVPCAYAARLTVVGRQMFAVRIDTPTGSSAVDWRSVHDHLAYTRIDVPDSVADGMHQLMQTLQLVYSASDWIVTPDGVWTFIGDLNPNGQWAWLEQQVDVPISEAIAEELAKECC